MEKYFVGTQSFSAKKFVFDNLVVAAGGKNNNREVTAFLNQWDRNNVIFFTDENSERQINGTKSKFAGYFTGAKDEKWVKTRYTDKNKKYHSLASLADSLVDYLQEDADFYGLLSTVADGLAVMKTEANHTGYEEKGYRPQVLDELTEYITAQLAECGKSGQRRKREVYARGAVAVLTYFVSNGMTFMKTEERIAPGMEKYLDALPARVPHYDDRLVCYLHYDGGQRTLEYVAYREKYIFVHAQQGGAGKTTLLVETARNLASKGKKTVFIQGKKVDRAPEKGNFLIGQIAEMCDDWRQLAEMTNPFAVIKKRGINQNITLFIDGINEATAAGQKRLLEEITDLQARTAVAIVVSSRYEHSLLEKTGFCRVELASLAPEKILGGTKLEQYLKTDRELQEYLKKPMFLAEYMAPDCTSVRLADLIEKRHIRDVEKAGGDKDILTAYLAAFVHSTYREKGRQMYFTKQQLDRFVAENPSGNNTEYVYQQICSIWSAEGQTVAYPHENIRDWLIANNIAAEIADNRDCYATVTQFFSGDVVYPRFVKKLVKELADGGKVMECLREYSLSPQQWHSDKTAVATGIMAGIFGAEYGLHQLNLTAFRFDRPVADVYLYDSKVSDYTFNKNDMTSAVFALEWDENREQLYAVTRNAVIVYDKKLKQLAATDFGGNGRHIVYSRQDRENIAFVTADRQAYIYNKQAGTVSRVLEDRQVYAVAACAGGFVAGARGSVAIIRGADIRWTDIETEFPAIPAEVMGGRIVYGTGTEIRMTDGKTDRLLWSAQQLVVAHRAVLDDMEISRIVSDGPGRYFVMLRKPGVTLLCHVSVMAGADSRSYVIALLDGRDQGEDEKEKSSLMGTVSIDSMKFNDIKKDGEYLWCGQNTGYIFVYRRIEGVWKFCDCIKSLGGKFGESVESLCRFDNRLAAALSSRSLVLLDVAAAGGDIILTESQVVKGSNIGVRRLVLSRDRLKMYSINFNNSITVLSRNTPAEDFIFEEKIFIDNGWCWTACQGRGDRLYIGCGNSVYLYADGRREMVAQYRNKVESLYWAEDEDMLYVATGNSVKKLDTGRNHSETKTTVLKNRPLTFEMSSKGLLVGTTSAEKDKAVIYSLQGKKPAEVKTSETAGWYRSLQNTGGGFVAAGLYNGNSHYSVVYSDSFSEKYILSGHTGYTTCAKLVSQGENIVFASCSYDGTVNLYAVNSESEKTLQPYKTIPFDNGRVYDIAVDDTTIYACAEDGSVYRIDTETGDRSMLYHNTDLWISRSDMENLYTDSKISANTLEALKTMKNKI